MSKKWSTERFMKFAEEIFEECKDALAKGGKEYSTDDNKFNNFDRQAASLSRNPNLANITPYDVAVVYMNKHIDSITSGISIREDMRGRFVDAINYILLLAGMYERMRGNENEGIIAIDKSVTHCPNCGDLWLRAAAGGGGTYFVCLKCKARFTLPS